MVLEVGGKVLEKKGRGEGHVNGDLCRAVCRALPKAKMVANVLSASPECTGGRNMCMALIPRTPPQTFTMVTIAIQLGTALRPSTSTSRMMPPPAKNVSLYIYFFILRFVPLCCADLVRKCDHRCLEESSKASQHWEEACDTSSREFGKRWLVFDEGTGDVRLPDGTEEVDSQVNVRFFSLR